MSLPPLPPDPHAGTGYDWMEQLSGGWYAVGLWGSDGWNLGGWPYQIVAHYDGDDVYGFVSYTEGDLDLKQFPTREERDQATDQYFVWFNEFHHRDYAPISLRDGRLGPYRG